MKDGDRPGGAPSGMEATLGYRRTRWTPEGVTMELDLDHRHLNINGRVHGGLYATMIDDATGFAVCWHDDPAQRKIGATLTLNVDFIGVPTTERVIVTARRVGGGASIAFTSAEARDSAGALLATGTATYKIMRPRG